MPAQITPFVTGDSIEGEDGVVVFDAGVVLRDRPAGRCLLRLIVARQIGADGLPALAFVGGLHQHVGADVERLGIVRRKGDREAPLEAILQRVRAVAHGVIGPGVDVAHLAGAVVLARDQVAVGAGVDDLRIARIGRDPAAFAAAHVVPIAAR